MGYRIEDCVLILSGDPVGPEDALPERLTNVASFAERRGLRIAALGVSTARRPLFEQLGLRSLYFGDEAIVDTDSFSLESRAIRKVRQSVSRMDKLRVPNQTVFGWAPYSKEIAISEEGAANGWASSLRVEGKERTRRGGQWQGRGG